jgi:hypothetical protein
MMLREKFARQLVEARVKEVIGTMLIMSPLTLIEFRAALNSIELAPFTPRMTLTFDLYGLTGVQVFVPKWEPVRVLQDPIEFEIFQHAQPEPPRLHHGLDGSVYYAP